MNKKTLLRLPIVALMVAIFSVAVLAASPVTSGFQVFDLGDGGKEITHLFTGYKLVPGEGDDTSIPTNASWSADLQSKITALDKDLKIADFSYFIGYYIEPKTESILEDNECVGPYKVVINTPVGENEIGIIFHIGDNGSISYEVFKGKAEGAINTSEFSPFLVYKATAKTSAQTGEYAAPYIIMISVALVSCGAIFAIRAKKATK